MSLQLHVGVPIVSTDHAGIVGISGHGDEVEYAGWHVLLPVVIGLCTPVVSLLILAPGLMLNALPVLIPVLCVMLAATASIAIVSMLRKGAVRAVRVDAARGAVEITHAGVLADHTTRFPAMRIAAVEMAIDYDDDGYRWATPRLVLSDGEVILLPPDTTESQLAALRAAIARARV